MEELRERLAAEITKNETMAWQLELVNNEKMRLTELTGSLKSEVENLGGLAASAKLEPESPTSVQGRVRYQHQIRFCPERLTVLSL